MARRKIAHYVAEAPSNRYEAKVYRDPEYNEYRVTYWTDGIKDENADSFHHGLMDAHDTAKTWLGEEARGQPITNLLPGPFHYQVLVGNIGYVDEDYDAWEANDSFREWVKQSKASHGRAAGESVTLFKDGEVIREYVPLKGATTE